MITWLPYPDLEMSVSCLDGSRLRRQVRDAWRILNGLSVASNADEWLSSNNNNNNNSNSCEHVDCSTGRMWLGYELALCRYGAMAAQACETHLGASPVSWSAFKYRAQALVLERTSKRAYNSEKDRIESALRLALAVPPWLGEGRLHSSHREQLLRRTPEYYSQLGWVERAAQSSRMFWPTAAAYEDAGGPIVDRYVPELHAQGEDNFVIEIDTVSIRLHDGPRSRFFLAPYHNARAAMSEAMTNRCLN